jgi:hypothetical protein
MTTFGRIMSASIRETKEEREESKEEKKDEVTTLNPVDAFEEEVWNRKEVWNRNQARLFMHALICKTTTIDLKKLKAAFSDEPQDWITIITNPDSQSSDLFRAWQYPATLEHPDENKEMICAILIAGVYDKRLDSVHSATLCLEVAKIYHQNGSIGKDDKDYLHFYWCLEAIVRAIPSSSSGQESAHEHPIFGPGEFGYDILTHLASLYGSLSPLVKEAMYSSLVQEYECYHPEIQRISFFYCPEDADIDRNQKAESDVNNFADNYFYLVWDFSSQESFMALQKILNFTIEHYKEQQQKIKNILLIIITAMTGNTPWDELNQFLTKYDLLSSDPEDQKEINDTIINIVKSESNPLTSSTSLSLTYFWKKISQIEASYVKCSNFWESVLTGISTPTKQHHTLYQLGLKCSEFKCININCISIKLHNTVNAAVNFYLLAAQDKTFCRSALERIFELYQVYTEEKRVPYYPRGLGGTYRFGNVLRKIPSLIQGIPLEDQMAIERQLIEFHSFFYLSSQLLLFAIGHEDGLLDKPVANLILELIAHTSLSEKFRIQLAGLLGELSEIRSKLRSKDYSWLWDILIRCDFRDERTATYLSKLGWAVETRFGKYKTYWENNACESPHALAIIRLQVQRELKSISDSHRKSLTELKATLSSSSSSTGSSHSSASAPTLFPPSVASTPPLAPSSSTLTFKHSS